MLDRLFKRRKVIYTWHDNFAPVVETFPGPYTPANWRWYCPDHLYIRLSSVYFWWLAGPGIHAGLNAQASIGRAQFIRWKVDLMAGIAPNGERQFCLFPGAFRDTSASAAYIKTNGLPFPCHMIPGDYLLLTIPSAIVGDYYHDLAIAYDRWELA